jgi:NAD(P)-dependent dehydrogenase (short-subunit alcohol dehydrogenase family)
MSNQRKTAIVTGASQGIGAGIVKAFVERGFNVVANSRKVTQSTEVAASDRIALVDGDIGESATAARIVETALSRFQSIDALVNNAGIFFSKPFTDYTAEDFKSLFSTNLEGFLYVTQLAIKQMLAQKNGGSIVTITAALARNPIRGVTAAVPMITKGGLETVTQHLAMEYAKDGIRINAVAPGVVETPLQRGTPREVMENRSPTGKPSTIKDIAAKTLRASTQAAGAFGYLARKALLKVRLLQGMTVPTSEPTCCALTSCEPIASGRTSAVQANHLEIFIGLRPLMWGKHQCAPSPWVSRLTGATL